jgi:hypothetical protein
MARLVFVVILEKDRPYFIFASLEPREEDKAWDGFNKPFKFWEAIPLAEARRIAE